MEDSQYKTIEEQALQIVGTLNKLKDEIEGYRDAKVETQKSLDSLDTLLGAVSDAAKQLSDAAKELRETDYTKLHKRLSKEAELVTSACETLQQNLEGIPSKVEAMLSSQQAKQEESQSAFITQIEKMVAAESSSRDALQRGIEAACNGMTEQVGQLPATLTAALEAHDAKQDEKDSELLSRVASLEEVIARIDRNTQKGFGKERG